MPAPLQPFVFISYAWESDALCTQAKALCDYLRSKRVTVCLSMARLGDSSRPRASISFWF